MKEDFVKCQAGCDRCIAADVENKELTLADFKERLGSSAFRCPYCAKNYLCRIGVHLEASQVRTYGRRFYEVQKIGTCYFVYCPQCSSLIERVPVEFGTGTSSSALPANDVILALQAKSVFPSIDYRFYSFPKHLINDQIEDFKRNLHPSSSGRMILMEAMDAMLFLTRELEISRLDEIILSWGFTNSADLYLEQLTIIDLIPHFFTPIIETNRLTEESETDTHKILQYELPLLKMGQEIIIMYKFERSDALFLIEKLNTFFPEEFTSHIVSNEKAPDPEASETLQDYAFRKAIIPFPEEEQYTVTQQRLQKISPELIAAEFQNPSELLLKDIVIVDYLPAGLRFYGTENAPPDQKIQKYEGGTRIISKISDIDRYGRANWFYRFRSYLPNDHSEKELLQRIEKRLPNAKIELVEMTLKDLREIFDLFKDDIQEKESFQAISFPYNEKTVIIQIPREIDFRETIFQYKNPLGHDIPEINVLDIFGWVSQPEEIQSNRVPEFFEHVSAIAYGWSWEKIDGDWTHASYYLMTKLIDIDILNKIAALEEANPEYSAFILPIAKFERQQQMNIFNKEKIIRDVYVPLGAHGVLFRTTPQIKPLPETISLRFVNSLQTSLINILVLDRIPIERNDYRIFGEPASELKQIPEQGNVINYEFKIVESERIVQTEYAFEPSIEDVEKVLSVSIRVKHPFAEIQTFITQNSREELKTRINDYKPKRKEMFRLFVVHRSDAYFICKIPKTLPEDIMTLELQNPFRYPTHNMQVIDIFPKENQPVGVHSEASYSTIEDDQFILFQWEFSEIPLEWKFESIYVFRRTEEERIELISETFSKLRPGTEISVFVVDTINEMLEQRLFEQKKIIRDIFFIIGRMGIRARYKEDFQWSSTPYSLMLPNVAEIPLRSLYLVDRVCTDVIPHQIISAHPFAIRKIENRGTIIMSLVSDLAKDETFEMQYTFLPPQEQLFEQIISKVHLTYPLAEIQVVDNEFQDISSIAQMLLSGFTKYGNIMRRLMCIPYDKKTIVITLTLDIEKEKGQYNIINPYGSYLPSLKVIDLFPTIRFPRKVTAERVPGREGFGTDPEILSFMWDFENLEKNWKYEIEYAFYHTEEDKEELAKYELPIKLPNVEQAIFARQDLESLLETEITEKNTLIRDILIPFPTSVIRLRERIPVRDPFSHLTTQVKNSADYDLYGVYIVDHLPHELFPRRIIGEFPIVVKPADGGGWLVTALIYRFNPEEIFESEFTFFPTAQEAVEIIEENLKEEQLESSKIVQLVPVDMKKDPNLLGEMIQAILTGVEIKDNEVLLLQAIPWGIHTILVGYLEEIEKNSLKTYLRNYIGRWIPETYAICLLSAEKEIKQIVAPHIAQKEQYGKFKGYRWHHIEIDADWISPFSFKFSQEAVESQDN